MPTRELFFEEERARIVLLRFIYKKNVISLR